jgi:hypothetical protein
MATLMKLPHHEVAHAAATDLANARMRAAGRVCWSEEDYNTAVREYNRIHPCPADVDCELCNPKDNKDLT